MMVRVAAFTIDDGESNPVVPGSLGVLGPQSVGRLIDKLIAVRANANDLRTPDGKATQDLRDRIAATQPSSFVKAVLARASTRVPSEVALLADLVSRHGRRLEGELLQIPSDLHTDFTAALMRWGRGDSRVRRTQSVASRRSCNGHGSRVAS